MSSINKNTTNARKKQFIERRKALISLSNNLRPLVIAGEFDTVNAALLNHYSEANEEIQEFNTFHQWKEKGFTINKGEKAFTIWGQPRKAEQTPEGSEEPEEYKYWPLCYLFANTQVTYTRKEATERPEISEVIKAPAMNLSEALAD